MWRYVGEGFIPGIPMRDIPDDEAKERGIVDVLKESKDYEHETDKPAAAASAPKGKDEESDSG